MSAETMNVGKYLSDKKSVFLDTKGPLDKTALQDALKTIWDFGSYFTMLGTVSLKIPSTRLLELGLLSERAANVVRKSDSELNVIVMEKKDDTILITETYRKGVFNYTASEDAKALGEPQSLLRSIFEQEMMVLQKNKDQTISFEILRRKVDPMKLEKLSTISTLDVSPTGADLDSIIKLLLKNPEENPFERVPTPTAQMINTTLALIIDGIGLKSEDFMKNVVS